MGLSRRQIDELLGAVALDAMDDADRAEFEAALAEDPESVATLAGFRQVVALMAESDVAAPPPEVRGRVLEAVGVIPPFETVDPSPPAEVYRHMVEAMAARLAALDEQAWTRVARPYEWTVQGLVAHLATIEEYMASKLGLMDFDVPDDLELDHLGMGVEVIAEEMARRPAQTLARWHQAAQAIVAHVARLGPDELAAAVSFHGWPFPLGALLVARSFEIWTHVDDIARANGLELMEPISADLRTMSTMSVESVPTILRLTGAAPERGHARLVLTGPGGGAFTVQLGQANGDEPLWTMVADVVDYCRVAAQRISPDQLGAQIEGDHSQALAFLSAAAAFAV